MADRELEIAAARLRSGKSIYDRADDLFPSLLGAEELEKTDFVAYARRFVERYGAPESFEDAFFIVQCFKREVVKYKQRKYGKKNVLVRLFQGLLTRLDDKYARINKLYGTSNVARDDKDASDTWLDISNYSDFGLMLMARLWGKPLRGKK